MDVNKLFIGYLCDDHPASVGEVEEVVGGIVVGPHSIAAESVDEEEARPGDPNVAAVEVIDEPAFDAELAESTVHVVEVEVLVGRGSGVDDGALGYRMCTLS